MIRFASRGSRRPASALVVVAGAVWACTGPGWAGRGKTLSGSLPPPAQAPIVLRAPRGLPLVEIPDDNPLTEAKVALGKQLYFDKRLSVDDTVSCASCHDPAKGWTDGARVSEGVRGRFGGRNSPTVLNAAYRRFQFWDGRASTLEEQALLPILNPVEMGMPSREAVAEKLGKIDGYREAFRTIFGAGPNAEDAARAIAAFERTLLAGEAPYDRFRAGDKVALSDSARRGLKLFFNKAHCAACHAGPSFTDDAFHNLGVGLHQSEPDRGRQAVSKQLGDRGAFRTPSLRDVARTAPYMHDGSLKTLDDVVAFYDKGGFRNPQLDEEIFPLKLTDREKQDLLTFLKEGLTNHAYPAINRPALPD